VKHRSPYPELAVAYLERADEPVVLLGGQVLPNPEKHRDIVCGVVLPPVEQHEYNLERRRERGPKHAERWRPEHLPDWREGFGVYAERWGIPLYEDFGTAIKELLKGRPGFHDSDRGD
jgi:hypothetical protein